MPTVPSFTQQVSSAPTSRQIGRVRATTGGATVESFGGGQVADQITQASSQLARAIGKISLAEKQKADNLSVMEFDTAVTKELDNLYYNPE